MIRDDGGTVVLALGLLMSPRLANLAASAGGRGMTYCDLLVGE